MKPDTYQLAKRRACLRRIVSNLALIFLIGMAGLADAQEKPLAATDTEWVRPIRTDSPRKTLASFLSIQENFEEIVYNYLSSKTSSEPRLLGFLQQQAAALIDLSAVPASSRREIGETTAIYLMDIFGRVESPPLDSLPDVNTLGDGDEQTRWRIPGTPIQIVYIDDGPRDGEFLFAANTVQAAPRFFEGIRSTPLRSRLGIESWTDAAVQFTGPLIPRALVNAIPEPLKGLWLGTPIWKNLVVVLLAFGSVVSLAWVVRFTERGSQDRIQSIGWRIFRPVSLLACVYVLHWFLTIQIDLSGRLSAIVETVATLAIYVAWAWFFWLVVLAMFEWSIRSPHIPDESVDANLLRLLARCIGLVGGGIILAVGGQNLGLPVWSLLAGFGVGGLAVALAIRPTLENLIGGIILYVDKPVRVGDFCTFGDRMGTVEKIGVRSTQLRERDRTLISIPNSKFADLELVNWAECDKMLINTSIGVRYETTPDQMRFVLASLREMMIAHPKIETETVRVRMSEFADFSKNINIRIFALTTDWNDYFAIREDVFLRMDEIVTKAGVGFAFPSRTLYLGRDLMPDNELGAESEEQVEKWRQSGELPFPTARNERIAAIDGTLDYPPRGSGSPDSISVATETAAEPLAAPATGDDDAPITSAEDEKSR